MLCAQTASLSVGVGTACTVYEPAVVLEALCLTAAIVLGLTTYTFHAARKGYSFQRLGPILFAGDFFLPLLDCMCSLMISWSLRTTQQKSVCYSQLGKGLKGSIMNICKEFVGLCTWVVLM